MGVVGIIGSSSNTTRKPDHMLTQQSLSNRRARDAMALDMVPTGDGWRIPDCPATIAGRTPLRKTKLMWEAFQEASEITWIRPHHMGMVRRMFELHDTGERALRRYNVEPEMMDIDGNPKTNPSWHVYLAAVKELRTIEDRLGMNPLSQLRLNIDAGAAAKAMRDMSKIMDQIRRELPEGAEVVDPRVVAENTPRPGHGAHKAKTNAIEAEARKANGLPKKS